MDEKQLKTVQAYNNTADEFSNIIGRLSNYNHTYDYLLKKLNSGDTILDLACGPAQISKYLKDRKIIKVVGVDLSEKMLSIAKKNIPDGTFYNQPIQNFGHDRKFDAVILGFGIPYLNMDQARACIKNACELLKEGKYLYLSFMHGSKQGFEKTSFGGENQFFIFYHDKSSIKDVILNCGLSLLKEYSIDYVESDGSITEDIVIIAKNE